MTVKKMTVNQALQKLEAKGDERLRAYNAKRGAGDKQFGVKMGDIRNIAKEIKTDHELALGLWKTEFVEARLLAILILKPKELSNDLLGELVASESYTQIADWFYSYVLKKYPLAEELRRAWMNEPDKMKARAAWHLTSDKVVKDAGDLDLSALLDRIESEMAKAPPEVQWTMNFTLAQIGINHDDYRERCMEIGEKLGIYRDYPVSKGCTSPFAPIWINEMVSRKQ